MSQTPPPRQDGDPGPEGMTPQPSAALTKIEAPPVPARTGETASTAVAARSRAEVEARYAVALKFPRSWMDVRNRMLANCARHRFAETSRYAKPVGSGKVMGWSVRFAEAMAREMGNLYIGTTVVWDDDEKRIIQVMVTDLESNTTYPMEITIVKTIERKSSAGYEVVSSRTNKQNQTIYIVKATDDDLLNKQNSQISKALRNSVLRLAPGDLLDECFDAIQESLSKADKSDPKGQIKKLSAAFYEIGVSAKMIAEFLGMPTLENVAPEQLAVLRTIYTGLKEGETSWDDVMAQKEGVSPTTAAKGQVGLREKLAGKPAPDIPASTTAEELAQDAKVAAADAKREREQKR